MDISGPLFPDREMDISRPVSSPPSLALARVRPQDRDRGATLTRREDAMYERDDAERRDEIETTREHPAHCGCAECDPDFYFDRAELREEHRAA